MALGSKLKSIRDELKKLEKLITDPDVERLLEGNDQIASLEKEVAELRLKCAKRQEERNAFAEENEVLRQKIAICDTLREENSRLAKKNEILGKQLDEMFVDRCKLEKLEAQGYIDPETTKVVRLIRTSNSVQETASEDVQQTLQDKCLELERAEARVEKLQAKFTKKMKAFRDGIHELLGWRVEQFADGKWGLTSVLSPEEGKLIFRPNADGFELLDSPWMQRLEQSTASPFAFLRQFNSVPGFLSHITQDLILSQTMT